METFRSLSPRPGSFRRARSVFALVAAVAMLLASVALLLGSVAPAAAAQDSPDADSLISRTGIGGAFVGSTIDQLRAQLGAGWTFTDEGQVIVDFYGYEVSKDGVPMFYALGGLNEDELSLFITIDPSLQTAEGIGAQSTIADAESVYGEATLSFNFENEGREFVGFEREPEGRISFRGGGGGAFAGVYDGDETTTTVYSEGAVIESVWVSCVVGLDCPALAITGPGESMRLLAIGGALLLAGITMQTMATRRLQPSHLLRLLQS